MNNQLCIIWFVTPVAKNVSLKWKFQVCAPCLVNWIEAKAGVEFIPSVGNKFQKATELNSHIPWINYQWNEPNHEDMEKGKLAHNLTYEEWFEFLKGSGDLQSLERFSMIMLNIVAVNGLDYRKCPKRDWNYIGIVDLKPCNEPLEWIQWGYSWEDPALYPFIKRTWRKLQNLCSIESEMLNDIQKVIRGEPCPNCGICIIKMSGWNHMVWSKCSYEFWWACLGHYPGYMHTESTFCPFRNVLIYYFVFFFFYLYQLMKSFV